MEGKFQAKRTVRGSPKMAMSLPFSRNCKTVSACEEGRVRSSIIEDKLGEEARSSGTAKVLIKTLNVI